MRALMWHESNKTVGAMPSGESKRRIRSAAKSNGAACAAPYGAEARRQRSSQGWLSRAASWVASQFNSLMNRARQAFNAAVALGDGCCSARDAPLAYVSSALSRPRDCRSGSCMRWCYHASAECRS